MDNDEIDFSELDPMRDSARFELAVDRISAAAAPLLARRRLQESVWWQLTAWRKPVIAMGIASLLLFFGVTEFTPSTNEAEALDGDDLALALGVPESLTEWVVTDDAPSAARVLYPGAGE